MQIISLLVSICNGVEEACRSFNWNSNSNRRKVSLVKWDNLCQPKDRDGLGIKYMKIMNKALLMKIGWGLITNLESFWAQVLKSTYLTIDQHVLDDRSKQNCSNLWKRLQ